MWKLSQKKRFCVNMATVKVNLHRTSFIHVGVHGKFVLLEWEVFLHPRS